MKKLIGDLLKEGTVITDGSWGTQLQELGLPVGECPDIWNITKPQMVERVAKSYVEAGSKIILTNTFRSSKIALNDFGYGDKVKEINKAGVEISKRASEGKAFVFASVGPTGKMIMMGEVTEEEMFEAFKEQIQTISEAGADGIIIETMSDLNEAKIALKAAKETALPVVVSMAFDSGKDKGFTMMGNSPEQTAKELTEAGADVIGANCGQGIEGFINICKKLKTSTNLPVWIKPNAGLPEFDGSKAVYKTSPVEFVKYVPDLLNSGADFIGGCCGTNPEFIKAVIRKINTGK
jgi:methionine synthase I (cobalamin-dependent)